MTKPKPGFALMLVLVMIAIVAAIAAAAAPYLDPAAADKKAADSTAQMLLEISNGINSMELAVARKFPGRPSQLTNPLTTAGTYRIMSCWNNTFSGADSTTAAGVQPFAAFYIPTTGLWLPIGGRLRDSVENRAGATNTLDIWLNIRGVTGEMADLLDITVDGVADQTAGKVLYSDPVANDTTTVRYRVTPRELNRC